MPVSPPDDALKDILIALRAEHPALGIAKLQNKLISQHPEWAVSEKRIRKMLGQSASQARPTSRLIDNLNVSKWTNKVKVVDYGPAKGKGLEATQEIKVGHLGSNQPSNGTPPTVRRKARMSGKRTRSS